jgi:hypothetical protein
MDRSNLVEIKKGQTGTGLLIESDGYISPEVGDNKQLFESYRKLNESMGDGEWHCPYPFIVSAIFQKADTKNANGRIYPEYILKREVENFQKKIREKTSMGELNHPSDSVVDLGRIGLNIIELKWINKTVVGKLEIVTSPGFRKYGICSTCGDQAANLILSGCKIGVSSRGLGTVTQKFGDLYVGEDFELVTWDLVSEPSTPSAWVFPDNNIPSNLIESDETTKNKSPLFEKLDKFNNWLNE